MPVIMALHNLDSGCTAHLLDYQFSYTGDPAWLATVYGSAVHG